MSALKNLYQRLPPPARHLAATAYGLRMYYWRYSGRWEERVQAALERDRWSAEQWAIYRQNRLDELLHRAATRVPYYRDHWAERRRKGDRSPRDVLENWPVLTKEVLRLRAQDFVADDVRRSRLYYEHSSGTTGTPVSLWFPRESILERYAILEARTRRWNGVTRYWRWATLGGQTIIPSEVDRPPFWVFNAVQNQLYLSTAHLSPGNVPHYVDAINRYRLTHMIGYNSSAAYLADEMIRQGLRLHDGFKVYFGNAEPLHPWQRSLIAEAFGCAVRETYGMSEEVVGASECAEGHLHLWPELGVVEVLDAEDRPVAGGNNGRLICTGLLNPAQPLIRYAVGDNGHFPAEQPDTARCCSLPVIGRIDGRSDDMVILRNRRRVYSTDSIFYDLPIREGQVYQESLDTFRIRYVPTEKFQPEHAEILREGLHRYIGQAQIIMEPMAEIPREANGKLRAVICAISPEERQSV